VFELLNPHCFSLSDFYLYWFTKSLRLVEAHDGVVVLSANKSAFEAGVGVFVGVEGDGRGEGEAGFEVVDVEFSVEVDPHAAIVAPGLAGEGHLDAGGDEVIGEGLEMFADFRDFHCAL
jgi:hypothetical protein